MSLPQPPISPEQMAALPPEAQALLRVIIEHYEKRIQHAECEWARSRATSLTDRHDIR
jgi:hypothetical protein